MDKIKTHLNSKSEAARHFGVSIPTVTGWITAGMPCDKGSRGNNYIFEVEQVTKWLRAHKSKLGAPASSKTAKFNKEKLRKLTAEADLAQMKAAEIEGKLVRIEDVSSVIENEYAIVRTHLLALPTAISPHLIDKDIDDIQNILTASIEGILNELSSAEKDFTGTIEDIAQVFIDSTS